MLSAPLFLLHNHVVTSFVGTTAGGRVILGGYLTNEIWGHLRGVCVCVCVCMLVRERESEIDGGVV